MENYEGEPKVTQEGGEQLGVKKVFRIEWLRVILEIRFGWMGEFPIRIRLIRYFWAFRIRHSIAFNGRVPVYSVKILDFLTTF